MNTKQIRLSAYLTQRKFAERLGVSVSSVRAWEQNLCKPNITQQGKIVAFCRENNIPIETKANNE